MQIKVAMVPSSIPLIEFRMSKSLGYLSFGASISLKLSSTILILASRDEIS
jgi:hypothetical protein